MLRNTRIACTLSLLLAAASAGAQVRLVTDVVYADLGQRKLHLDLYLPSGSGPAPCVVWLHWGGWRTGHRTLAREDAKDLASYGLAVAAVEYRFSGEAKWPAQIHDCKGAVRWLRANASTYNLDPDRFAAFGNSAGGQLAAMLGTSGGVPEMEGTVGGNLDKSSRVQFVAAFASPTDLFGPPVYEPANSFPSELVGKGIGEIKQNINKPEYAQWVELVRSVNPARYVTRDDPPFYLAHGITDNVVPLSQSDLLHNALLAAGVTSTLEKVSAGHTLPTYVWIKRQRHLVDMLLKDVAFRVYGKGCSAAGANEPAIGALGPPKRGTTFDLTLTSGPASQPAVTMLCSRRTYFPLQGLGAPDCAFLVIDPALLHVTLADAKGAAECRLPLPAQLPAGIVLWVQWVSFAPKANGLGWVFSNAARVAIQ